MPFHVFNLPEAEVLYKDNSLCFGLIRSLGHLFLVRKEQQNLFFFQVTYVLALVESCGNQNPYNGTISLKENLTVISLLYPLNQVSADMVLGVNTFD